MTSGIDSEGVTIEADRDEPPGSATIPPRPSFEHHRFVLLQKIDEGGFGDVWEAVQSSLGRRIAVKRLKDASRSKPDKPAGIGREMERIFRQEALTAGHLEHPNIVPVYDLGLDENGRPLLAMKLVQGQRWSDILRDEFEQLPAHEYLTRNVQVLISVAQAVAFAHSHGIVHRDLKPSQVMIGSFGEVLLMDWGLAMAYPLTGPNRPDIPWATDADSPLFHPMTPAGSPNYMAPEQTEPTTDNLGPWTDVFLLGGMLYRVLTGQPPHLGQTSEETFARAREGKVDVAHERAPDRDIPTQLSALAQKAMHPNPAMRIRTAAEFLKGVQDYLSGADKRRESIELCETVAAELALAKLDYPALGQALNSLDRSLVYWPENRDAKRLRRKALNLYARTAVQNRDLKLARVQAERLDAGPERDALLGEIRELEDLQRRQDQRLAEALGQAKADRDRAETLVRFLIGDLHQALKSIGRLDVIRRVTQESLTYFDSLTAEEATDESLHNRCIAYLNIGDVLSDEGKKPEAALAYHKANDIARQLVGRDPHRLEWLIDLADSHEGTGQMHYYQGHMNEALQDHAAALAIRSRMADLSPDMPIVRKGIASSHHRLGIIHWRNQHFQEALRLQTKSLEEFRRLASEYLDQKEFEVAVGWNLSTLGNVYRDLGKLPKAIEVTKEGLAIRIALAEQEPQNASYTEDLLWTRSNLALLLLMDGQLEESLEMFRADIEIRRRFSDQDPANVVRLNAITFPLSMITEILFMLGRVAEAEESIRECVKITTHLLELDPTSTHVIGAYARQTGQLCEILCVAGPAEEARDMAKRSREAAERVVALAPRNAMFVQSLARALAMNAFFEAGCGNRHEAKRLCVEAERLLASLSLPSEDVDLIDLHAQLSLIQGNFEDADRRIGYLENKNWLSPYVKLVRQTLRL